MQITLEGREGPIPAQEGDTVLESLLRAGIPFPFSCQAGNCGTCKCELLSGDVFELEHSGHTLAAEARAGGMILACRAQVRGDIAIRRIDIDAAERKSPYTEPPSLRTQDGFAILQKE